MVTGTVLCNNILRRAFEERIKVNPRKLQKLLYYTALEYQHKTGKVLFSEYFSAWSHGPVLQSVYEEFKSYDSSTIITFARDSKGNVPIVSEEVDQDIIRALDEVWARYKDSSGEDLTELSHRTNSAWALAMNDKNPLITKEYMESEIHMLYGHQ